MGNPVYRLEVPMLDHASTAAGSASSLDFEFRRQRISRWLRPLPVALLVTLMLAVSLAGEPHLSPQAAINLLAAQSLVQGDGLTVWGQPPAIPVRPGMPGLLALWQGVAGTGDTSLKPLLLLILAAALVCCYAVWSELGHRSLSLLTALVTASSLAVSRAASQPTADGPTLCLTAVAMYAWLRGSRSNNFWLWLGSAAWIVAGCFHAAALPLAVGASLGLLLQTGRSARAWTSAALAVGSLVGIAWYCGEFWPAVASATTGSIERLGDLFNLATQFSTPRGAFIAAAVLVFVPSVVAGAAALLHGPGRIAVLAVAMYLLAGAVLGLDENPGLLPAAPVIAWCFLEGLPRVANKLRVPPAHAAAAPLMVGSLLMAVQLAESLRRAAWPAPDEVAVSQRSLHETAKFLAAEQAPGDRMIAPAHAEALSYLCRLPCEPIGSAQRLARQLPQTGAPATGLVEAPLIVLPRGESADALSVALRRALRYHHGYSVVFRNDHFEVYRELDATAVRILAAGKPAADIGPAPPRLARRERTVKRPPVRRPL